MEAGRNRLLEILHEEKTQFLAFAHRRMQGLSSLDPEDVISEVLHKLLERGDLIAEIENLVGYIYQALGNRIVDSRRREGRSRHPECIDLDLLPDPGPDPHAALHDQQLRARLTQALDSLMPKERTIWLATEVEGQSFRHLADLWGEPLGTLLSRKSRATAKLRRHLADLR